MCLVDLTGQDRDLPGLGRQKQPQPQPNVAENVELEEVLPWKVGFSETSGIRNKCVSGRSHERHLKLSDTGRHFALRFTLCRTQFCMRLLFCELIGGKLLFLLISFVKRIQSDVQDVVRRDAK